MGCRGIWAEALDQDLNRGDVDHCFTDFTETFIILAEPPVSGIPAEGSLDAPPSRLNNKSALTRFALHDFQIDTKESAQVSAQVPAIGLVGPYFEQVIETLERFHKQLRAAFEIRPPRRMHEDEQQIPHRVYQDVPFASLDLFFPRRSRVRPQLRSS